MKESIFDKILRQMRLRQIVPHLREFDNPRVLDVGCGWEARLLRQIEPFIAKGVGIDFKAPEIETEKLSVFGYVFERDLYNANSHEPNSPLDSTNSACSDFLGSASASSLQRTASASHSSASHNPKNSSTILEFANSNSSLTQDTRILGESQSDSADSNDYMESNAKSLESSLRGDLSPKQSTPFYRHCEHSQNVKQSIKTANFIKTIESQKDSNDSIESSEKMDSHDFITPNLALPSNKVANAIGGGI